MRKKCTELSNNEYVEKTYKFFFVGFIVKNLCK